MNSTRERKFLTAFECQSCRRQRYEKCLNFKTHWPTWNISFRGNFSSLAALLRALFCLTFCCYDCFYHNALFTCLWLQCLPLSIMFISFMLLPSLYYCYQFCTYFTVYIQGSLQNSMLNPFAVWLTFYTCFVLACTFELRNINANCRLLGLRNWIKISCRRLSINSLRLQCKVKVSIWFDRMYFCSICLLSQSDTKSIVCITGSLIIGIFI